jgi:hypothetical protein
MQVQDAENFGSLDGGGRIILSIDELLHRFCVSDTYWNAWAAPSRGPPRTTRTTRFASRRATIIDIRKHFAQEVIQDCAMRLVRVSTSAQLADMLTKRLHLAQSTMCVEGTLRRRRTSTLKGTSVLKRGRVAKAIKSSHVGP